MKIEVERAAPRNKQDLIRLVLQAWTEHYGVDLVSGVPGRLVKCLELNGGCISR